MAYFMGIDGGGSTIRILIVDEALSPLIEVKGGAVNPNSMGYDHATTLIRATIQQALAEANLIPSQIHAVCIGIAGVHDYLNHGWLTQVVQPVLPTSLIRPSADHEIALVGALGERYGLLVLAGTGSIVFGVNRQGESAIVGGWGHLLGDEGSGYSLGIQALQAITCAFDGQGVPTTLTEKISTQLGFTTPWNCVGWLYGQGEHVPRVAELALLVLDSATEGDKVAQEIVEHAAQGLAHQAQTAIHRLALDNPPIAFAGSVLINPNPLSQRLCELLHLSEIPTPRYRAVVGAALLAKEEWLCTTSNKK